MAQHPLLPLPKALLVDGKALHIEVIEPVEARIARAMIRMCSIGSSS